MDTIYGFSKLGLSILSFTLTKYVMDSGGKLPSMVRNSSQIRQDGLAVG